MKAAKKKKVEKKKMIVAKLTAKNSVAKSAAKKSAAKPAGVSGRSKKTKIATKKTNKTKKIAAKIRPKVLNAKNVEQAAVAPPVPPRQKQDSKEPEFEVKKTKIRIIGIGGGGSNIVSEIAQKVKKSSFYIANTDAAALRRPPKSVSVFQFGESFTQGLGTGMDPRVGEEAAAEAKEKIKKITEGQDLVILVASLGGGTGSGAVPVFAQIAKASGSLTYGIFTLPFEFEGDKKSEIAKNALEKVKPHLSALTILPNERVFEVVPKATPFAKTLSYINTALSDSLQGLIETIYDIGVINIDFADLCAILAGNGKMAFLNSATFKKGQETDLDSFEKAFSSPLYPYSIDKTRGLLLNVVAKNDLKLIEVNKILTRAAGRIHKDAKIIFGVSHEGALAGAVKVTVLATGCLYDGIGGGQKNGKGEFAAEKVRAAAPPKPKRPRFAAKKPAPPKKKAAKHDTAPKTLKISKQKQAKHEAKDVGAVKVKTVISDVNKSSKQEDLDIKESAPADNYQSQQGIAAQFEAPVRKNALQVKKEIELEERQILEEEKNWEVPTFLRKQKK